MKRNITISSMSQAFSTSKMEKGLVMGVAFLCRSIWDRTDLRREHPEPLGYLPTSRSGWPQFENC